MHRSILALAGAFVLLLGACEEEETSPPPRPPSPPVAAASSSPVASAQPEAAAPLTVEQRVDDLVRQMTLEEKIDYLGGDRDFFIRAVPRLGIPEIKMADGPAGCRNYGETTAYVAPIGLAATFDGSLADRVGAALASDCRARGVHILLAPGMNIARTPLGGRNFEYLGEDPLLAGRTAAEFVRGVQGGGVLATAKHFVGNDQEWDRNNISSEIDERTLHEIYLAPFERVVREAHVGDVMTAYNLLNGTYCTHNKWLLRELLEKDWGFQGFVMSDWKAAHDTMGALEGGLDLEMPAGKYINRETVLPLLKAGKIDQAAIDGRVRRILLTLARAGFLDRPQKTDTPADDPKSAEVALEEARKSAVLLQNRGDLLPLDRAKIKRIAVIGPNADPAVVGGYGSAFTTPFHAVSLLAGIKQAAAGATVEHHVGVHQTSEFAVLGRPVFDGKIEQAVYLGTELAGQPISVTTVDHIDYHPEGGLPTPPVPQAPSENFSIRWKGKVDVKNAGAYRFITNTDDGVRVLVDGKKLIEDWNGHSTKTNQASLRLTAGKHDVVVEYFQGTGGAVAQFGMGPDASTLALEGGAEVTALAKKADVVVVSIGFGQNADTNSVSTAFPGRWPPDWARKKGLVEAEDSDRPWELPAAQIETVRLAAAANPRTIVVVNAGGGVDLTKFLDKVPAVLWAWYPGQEGGRALAEILFGDVDPSGRLPVTFAKRYEDYPSAPYYQKNDGGKTPYTEGVFVGYRGFLEKHVEPLFPFGFGLSYTKFEYTLDGVETAADGSRVARGTVKNVGPRDGDAVVELYVAPPKGSVPRPPMQLAGFQRVPLHAGESKPFSAPLDAHAFAYWDEHASPPGFRVEAGSYEIDLAASAADIRSRRTVQVAAQMLP